MRNLLNSLAIVLGLGAATCGCVDQPHCLAPPGTASPASQLSRLGLYQGAPADLAPVAGVVPYDVNVSLYSDEAHKQRFIRLPSGTTVQTTEDRWQVPAGTWLIKNFYYPIDARDLSRGRRLIETRILVVEEHGLTASTYLWRADQSDAECSGGNVDVPTAWIDERGDARVDHFHIPGTSQCGSCHNQQLLGWRTRQMNRGDQLATLLQAHVIDGPPANLSALADPFGAAPLADRARSYLDANCGSCHNSEPGATAASTSVFFDWDHELSALSCRSTRSVGGRDRVIVPGRPDRSALFTLMRESDPFLRMPRGPTHIPDGAGIAVLSDWVASLPPQACP
jgi:hypothetical protein